VNSEQEEKFDSIFFHTRTNANALVDQ